MNHSKMQLRRFMNGHAKHDKSAFLFSADRGLARSHRMQRKLYRGLSNSQCIHGVEIVTSPDLYSWRRCRRTFDPQRQERRPSCCAWIQRLLSARESIPETLSKKGEVPICAAPQFLRPSARLSLWSSCHRLLLLSLCWGLENLPRVLGIGCFRPGLEQWGKGWENTGPKPRATNKFF